MAHKFTNNVFCQEVYLFTSCEYCGIKTGTIESTRECSYHPVQSPGELLLLFYLIELFNFYSSH